MSSNGGNSKGSGSGAPSLSQLDGGFFIALTFQVVFAFVLSLLHTLSLMGDVLLHRDLGERHLSFVRLFMAWAFLGLMLFAVAYPNRDAIGRAFAGSGESEPVATHSAPADAEDAPAASSGFWTRASLAISAVVLAVWIVVLPLVQMGLIIRRNRRGIRCHSRYWGDSLLYPPFAKYFTQYTFQHGVEQAIAFAASVVLLPFLPALAIFLAYTSVVLSFRAAVSHWQLRAKFLDRLDSEIESRVMEETYGEWKDPGLASTQGYVLPSFFAELSAPPPNKVDMQLPPELLVLLTGAATGISARGPEHPEDGAQAVMDAPNPEVPEGYAHLLSDGPPDPDSGPAEVPPAIADEDPNQAGMVSRDEITGELRFDPFNKCRDGR